MNKKRTRSALGKGKRKTGPGTRSQARGGDDRKPLTIRKLTLSIAALRKLPKEQRSAILLLGLFLNEANWLRKLLVMATMSMGDNPDGQANFALTVQLATTLAGKIYEGLKKVRAGDLAKTIHTVPFPDGLKTLQKEINRAMKTPTITKIRNTYSFHYPASLDFIKLASIDDADSVLYVTESAYNGDVFSHLSSLAALEPLLAMDDTADWRNGLTSIWNEITKISGLYCQFLSETLALLMSHWLSGEIASETTIEPHAPEIHNIPLRFFAHAPTRNHF